MADYTPSITPWSVARAVVLSVVLLGHGIYALPLPTVITKKDMREEWRQADLELWVDMLGSVGIAVEKPWLEQATIDFTTAVGGAHKKLKKPFQPFARFTGTGQAWALFASATTSPDRMLIAVERGNGWEPLYERLHPEHTWRDSTFRFRRIRGIWDGVGKKPKSAFRGFTKWTARQIFREFPDVTRVRVRLVRSYSTLPWEPDDDSEVVRHTRTHERKNHEGEKLHGDATMQP